MAITVTTLKGNNSVSADRITINDNFKITTNAINGILGVVNTTTGKINNTNVGSDNTITTEGITLTNTNGATATALDVQQGSISIQSGNITLASDSSYIELGTDNSKIIDNIVSVGASGPNGNHVLGLENFIGIEIPRLTTTEKIEVIPSNDKSVLVFDTDLNTLSIWSGVAWIDL